MTTNNPSWKYKRKSLLLQSCNVNNFVVSNNRCGDQGIYFVSQNIASPVSCLQVIFKVPFDRRVPYKMLKMAKG